MTLDRVIVHYCNVFDLINIYIGLQLHIKQKIKRKKLKGRIYLFLFNSIICNYNSI
jgi:hypothetical protein